MKCKARRSTRNILSRNIPLIQKEILYEMKCSKIKIGMKGHIFEILMTDFLFENKT